MEKIFVSMIYIKKELERVIDEVADSIRVPERRKIKQIVC